MMAPMQFTRDPKMIPNLKPNLSNFLNKFHKIRFTEYPPIKTPKMNATMYDMDNQLIKLYETSKYSTAIPLIGEKVIQMQAWISFKNFKHW
jgi:hypothetical protein